MQASKFVLESIFKEFEIWDEVEILKQVSKYCSRYPDDFGLQEIAKIIYIKDDDKTPTKKDFEKAQLRLIELMRFRGVAAAGHGQLPLKDRRKLASEKKKRYEDM